MQEQRMTSLALSKWLSKNGFEGEGEYCWVIKDNKAILHTFSVLPYDCTNLTIYLAYDLIWDLCIRYGKEIFKSDKYTYENETALKDFISIRTREVLYLLQQGKKQEAEEYIKTNSILNK